MFDSSPKYGKIVIISIVLLIVLNYALTAAAVFYYLENRVAEDKVASLQSAVGRCQGEFLNGFKNFKFGSFGGS